MRLRVVMILALLIAGSAAVVPILAQEGHPLTGTWLGEWGKEGEQITFVVKWDATERDKSGKVVMEKNAKGEAQEKVRMANGKPSYAVTGMFNPGPNSSIATLTLDSAKWTVHIETDFKDDNGKVSKVVADGKLDKVGSYNRTITGTWTQGGVKGDFKLKRD